jgi:hypothetical protein
LTDHLSLIPRFAAARFNGWCQHLELLQLERSSKREFHIYDGKPTGRQISMLRFDSAGSAGNRDSVWNYKSELSKSLSRTVIHVTKKERRVNK